MIRLLLVDDHPVVRTGYQRLLEQAGDIVVVAQAERADQAYAEFVARQPDVTVTDLSMPGSGGLELIRRILAREASARGSFRELEAVTTELSARAVRSSGEDSEAKARAQTPSRA